MAELKELKCKNCGEPLPAAAAAGGVIKCKVCDHVFILPKEETTPKGLYFLNQAEGLLETREFDKAYSLYAKAAEECPNEPEAYFGMALSGFRVQYVRDLKDKKDASKVNEKSNFRLQPICHSFTNRKFTEDKNYKKAISLATPEQRKEYKSKAEEIDYIREEFLKLEESGLTYDCFICVKVSRTDGDRKEADKKNWTQDAYDADAIYDLLKRNNFKPFYSEREIRGRTGADYEAMILYALTKAETMLLVCYNEDYLRTPWVNNEFTRFKELVNNREKENDSLTIVYNGTPIERLPDTRGKIQGIDYSRREADLEIVRFVEAHTPMARAKRAEEKRKQEEEKRRQEQENEEIRKQLEEIKKMSMNANSVNGAASTVNALLTRANQEMEGKDFKRAVNFFETALERAPENGAAWWGLFLCEFECLNEKSILNNMGGNAKKILSSKNYKNARRYADGELKKRIENFRAQAKNSLAANKEVLETKIKNTKTSISKLTAQKTQKEKQLSEQCAALTRQVAEFERDHDKKSSRSRRAGTWDTLPFWGVWLVVGILIAVAVFITLLVFYFNEEIIVEDYPEFMTWGIALGQGIGYAIFGGYLDFPFVIIGSALEGVVYGAALSVAVTIVFKIFQALFVGAHNSKVREAWGMERRSGETLETCRAELDKANQARNKYIKDTQASLKKLETELSGYTNDYAVIEECERNI